MLINQLGSHTLVFKPWKVVILCLKTNHFVSKVNFWHPTKNNKKMNDYINEVVKCTSISNSFKIKKNW